MIYGYNYGQPVRAVDADGFTAWRIWQPDSTQQGFLQLEIGWGLAHQMLIKALKISAL